MQIHCAIAQKKDVLRDRPLGYETNGLHLRPHGS